MAKAGFSFRGWWCESEYENFSILSFVFIVMDFRQHYNIFGIASVGVIFCMELTIE